MARKMTREEQDKIAKMILENRQEFYDANVELMRVPMQEAQEFYRSFEGLPHDHPERKEAFAALRSAQTDYYDWQEENSPDAMQHATKERRKKMLGNKKKNLAAMRRKLEITDKNALTEVRKNIRTQSVTFGDWLHAGALITNKDGELALITEIIETHPLWCKVMIDGKVEWVSKKSLRPVDED